MEQGSKIPSHFALRLHLIRLITLLMISLFLSGCGKEDVEEKKEVVRPVKTMTVIGVEASFRHSFPGTVRAGKRSEISFKVAGPLVELPVEEGQVIKKGELIAQIQKRDYQTALDQAVAKDREADRQFRRYKELYAKKQVSRADYDRWRASRDVARAQLEDARNALDDTSLTAPFDGVVSKRFVENYKKVQANEPIVNLQDIRQIEILVDVPELLIAEIRSRKDAVITATFESVPGKEYAVTIKEFATEADPATQTYQVVLLMEQPLEANILPGMTAMVTSQAEDQSESAAKTIIIPAIAVMDAPGNEPYVWLLDKEKSTVRKVTVSIGSIKGSENILVKEGLEGGEILVTAGITQLQEGMKVRPWEKQREGK
ncbi:MAG: efflux RND transporter periplasmic adaptor subunit [Thermodesulfobacteriota bacterium]